MPSLVSKEARLQQGLWRYELHDIFQEGFLKAPKSAIAPRRWDEKTNSGSATSPDRTLPGRLSTKISVFLWDYSSFSGQNLSRLVIFSKGGIEGTPVMSTPNCSHVSDSITKRCSKFLHDP